MPTKLKPRHAEDPQFRNALSTAEASRTKSIEDWLAQHSEEILEPDLPIVDAHHHLYKRPGFDYFFDEYRADAATGHNIRASVYVDCGTGYLKDGPEHMRVVGEVAYAKGVADKAASGQFGKTLVCAGIVSSADVTLGAEVAEVLDAQISVGGGRFSGIRVTTKWDPHPALNTGRFLVPRYLMADSDFRAGFAQLGPRKLSFDAMILFHQLLELRDLAQAFPDTHIVLNHIGGLVAKSTDYLPRHDEAVAEWRRNMTELGKCRNVYVKLGGLGMPYLGYNFDLRDKPAPSTVLADAWQPYFQHCIDAFGPDRCMFESNYPPDKQTASFAVLWNAFKRIASGYSADEKRSLFYSSAAEAYRLKLD